MWKFGSSKPGPASELVDVQKGDKSFAESYDIVVTVLKLCISVHCVVFESTQDCNKQMYGYCINGDGMTAVLL